MKGDKETIEVSGDKMALPERSLILERLQCVEKDVLIIANSIFIVNLRQDFHLYMDISKLLKDFIFKYLGASAIGSDGRKMIQ